MGGGGRSARSCPDLLATRGAHAAGGVCLCVLVCACVCLCVLVCAGVRRVWLRWQAAKLKNSARVRGAGVGGIVTGGVAGGVTGAILGRGVLGGIVGTSISLRACVCVCVPRAGGPRRYVYLFECMCVCACPVSRPAACPRLVCAFFWPALLKPAPPACVVFCVAASHGMRGCLARNARAAPDGFVSVYFFIRGRGQGPALWAACPLGLPPPSVAA
jgi:hypothetical protein